MKEANPRAHVNRLLTDGNYLGAYLYVKEADLEKDERVELIGMVAGAVADQLSRTRRDDRERIYYLRSILAWILRDVPGLGSLYREQLRDSHGSTGLLGSVTRGLQNAGDMATGRKTVTEGIQDAADDVRRGFEDATDSVRTGQAETRVNEFLSSAEKNIRQGLDQLGDFFRGLNDNPVEDEEAETTPDEGEPDSTRAARADADGDVEDAAFESEEEDTSGKA